MLLQLENIPKGWWLECLCEVRTRIIYAGDQHTPTGQWSCALQHEAGGLLTSVSAESPQEALAKAIDEAIAVEARARSRGVL